MFIMFIYSTVNHTHQCLEKASCLIYYSEGNIQLLMPADYIQHAVTESCGWFYTQGVHRDAFGNELWQKLCLTDNDISSGNYTVNQIEFVHELYFVIVSHNSACIPVGYDWDTSGYKDVRYIVKVIFENGIFRTAYPVSCNHYYGYSTKCRVYPNGFKLPIWLQWMLCWGQLESSWIWLCPGVWKWT